MRAMILLKSNPDIESGRMPTEAELTEMGAFNEELAKAGVMVAGEGLHPSAQGARVTLPADPGEEPSVVDGPFAEAHEIVAGFWILDVASMEEAVEWVKRIPRSGVPGEIEVRRVFEAEDFGEEFTPELREREERLRAQTEGLS